MKIIHLNFANAGCGHYGLNLYKDFNRHTVISVYNRKLICSRTTRELLNNKHYILVELDNIFDKIKAIYKVAKLVFLFKPKVLHDTSGTAVTGSFLIWLLIKIIPGKKLIIHSHDPLPHSGMGKNIIFRISNILMKVLADYITVSGEKCLFMYNNVNHDKLRVVSHGHNGFFNANKFQIERERNTVLFFGALRPNKGFDILLNIVEEIKKQRKDFKFIIAGSKNVSKDLLKTGWGSILEKTLSRMKNQDEFEVYDRFIDDDEVEYFFKRASFLVLPYKDATYSSVAMIGLPFGNVIVTTNKGDLSNIIIDGSNGIVCDYDSTDFAKKLLQLFDDDALTEKISKSALQTYDDRFSWNISIRQLEAILDEIDETK